jgi:hypothetical protein
MFTRRTMTSFCRWAVARSVDQMTLSAHISQHGSADDATNLDGGGGMYSLDSRHLCRGSPSSDAGHHGCAHLTMRSLSARRGRTHKHMRAAQTMHMHTILQYNSHAHSRHVHSHQVIVHYRPAPSIAARLAHRSASSPQTATSASTSWHSPRSSRQLLTARRRPHCLRPRRRSPLLSRLLSLQLSPLRTQVTGLHECPLRCACVWLTLHQCLLHCARR